LFVPTELILEKKVIKGRGRPWPRRGGGGSLSGVKKSMHTEKKKLGGDLYSISRERGAKNLGRIGRPEEGEKRHLGGGACAWVPHRVEETKKFEHEEVARRRRKG